MTCYFIKNVLKYWFECPVVLCKVLGHFDFGYKMYEKSLFLSPDLIPDIIVPFCYYVILISYIYYLCLDKSVVFDNYFVIWRNNFHYEFGNLCENLYFWNDLDIGFDFTIPGKVICHFDKK